MLKEEILNLNSDLHINVDTCFLSTPIFDADNIPGGDSLLLLGDNLLSLIALNSMGTRIKLAYLDPPYNTGKEFIYNDSFESSFNPIWGHSAKWVEFMAVRLLVLKKLMSVDGYVILSIDDRELHNLITLANYIFGSENKLPTIVVKKNNHGKGSSKTISNQHEYIIIYRMSISNNINGIIETSREHKEYDKQDQYGTFRINGLFRKKGEDSLRSDRPNMFYPLYYDDSGQVYTDFDFGRYTALPIDSKNIERRWLWDVNKATRDSNLLYASKKGVIYVKDYYKEDKLVTPRSIWDSPSYFTENGTKELKTDLGSERVFESPKSVSLMYDLISLIPLTDGDTIADLFSGTGSFSIAVEKFKKDKNISLRCVSMESSNLISEKHLSYKLGYKKISDIIVRRLHKHNENIKIID